MLTLRINYFYQSLARLSLIWLENRRKQKKKKIRKYIIVKCETLFSHKFFKTTKTPEKSTVITELSPLKIEVITKFIIPKEKKQIIVNEFFFFSDYR